MSNRPAVFRVLSISRFKHTPLHHAVRAGDVAATKAVLELGAKMDAKDEQGQSPLHHAVLLGEVAIMQLLIRWSANLESGDARGYTPLHAAVRDGQRVEELLRSNAHLTSKTKQGDCPLHLACLLNRHAVKENCLQGSVGMEAAS